MNITKAPTDSWSPDTVEIASIPTDYAISIAHGVLFLPVVTLTDSGKLRCDGVMISHGPRANIVYLDEEQRCITLGF